MLVEASDEEVLEKLVAVRGLGRWSVEMFACFALKRMDIFSTGDLGVQRGMAAYQGRDVAKLKNKGGKWKYMSEADMVRIAEPFAPYRYVTLSVRCYIFLRPLQYDAKVYLADSFTGVCSCGICGGSKT
jgi:3-methyladenine DNA glycosylase/8-oxoguanine DNA glycosylase